MDKDSVVENEQLPSTVTGKDPKSGVETKAKAKVCMIKFLSSSLLEFKKKFPNWKNEVPLLLPQLGKKVKKKHKSEFVKEEPSVKINLKTTKKKIDDNRLVNTPGNNGFLVEDIKRRHNIQDSEANIASQKTESTGSPFHSNENSCGKEMTVCEKDDKKISEINRDSKKNVKKRKTNSESLQSKEKQAVDEKETKVVDPFFVTSDNSEYLTVATNEKQIAALKNISENAEFKTENSFSSQKYKDNKNTNNFKNFSKFDKFHSKKFNGKSDFREKVVKQKIVPNEGRKQSYNNTKSESNGEQLHPSWEAKRKQTSLVQFSGKKIVFSDD